MGVGFRGLILAAVLAATMSNLSASFNSSASSLMSDWLGRWLPKADERSGLRMARLLTVASAIVHAGGRDCGVRNWDAEGGRRPVLSDRRIRDRTAAWPVRARADSRDELRERTALIAFVVGTIVMCCVALYDTDQRLVVHAGWQLHGRDCWPRF